MTVARLDPPRGPVRAVLDTDAFNEIDDGFALVQMLLSPERIATEAIYAAPFANERAATPGEGMEASHAEVLRLLDRLGGPRPPVLRGVTAWVGPDKVARRAEAVDDLIRRARAGGGDDPLYVVAIGAISNVASALLAAPDIAARIVVVWLGGNALHWPHTKEFNLVGDLGAAQVLFDSGVPLVMCPCMNVVSHLHTTLPEIERHVAPHGAIGRFLAERFAAYAADPLGWSKVLWDMAPVAFLIEPDWLPSVLVPTPVLTDEPAYAQAPGRHLMRMVIDIDRDAIFRDFFAKLARAAA